MKTLTASFAALFLVLGCEPKPEVSAPKDSSAEAKALTDAASKAAAENPADALALAESIKNREDVSAADRAAALKAQQDAYAQTMLPEFRDVEARYKRISESGMEQAEVNEFMAGECVEFIDSRFHIVARALLAVGDTY